MVPRRIISIGSIKGVVWCALLVFLLPAQLLAQSPTQQDQAVRELERIQRQQEQRLQREREDHLSRQPRTELEVPEQKPAETAPAVPGPCRKISEIQLDQATSMALDEQQKITKAFAGRCLTVTDIEKLLGEITAWYFQRGMIGARAYIQTQNLAQGILNILVLEGQVEALRLEDGERGSVNLSTAFPGVVDAPLNLRDFEQGLDQINRLGSNSASLELQPGTRPGGTVAIIRNKPSRRFHGRLTADNYGSDSTGEGQAGVSVLLDNLAGINDGVSLTYRSTVEGGYGEQHSRSASLLYSVPFGRFLLSASQVFSDYATPIDLSLISLTAEGDSNISSLRVDYLAYSDRVNRFTLSSTLTVRDSKNYLEGARLDVSSQRLSSADLSGGWSTALWGGALASRLGVAQGLTWFGAEDDSSAAGSQAPRAQYLKWTAGVSWTRPWQLFGQDLLYGSSLNGQWSDDVLFGVEQLLIGGVFSVRGFRDNSLSGDRGWYLRNDVSAPQRIAVRGAPLALRPYLALDTGRIESRAGQIGGSLAGATLGTVASWAGFSLDMFASHAINTPGEFSDEGLLIYASMGYRL